MTTSLSERFRIGNKIRYKRGYLWVTLALFAVSISAHWAFAWSAFVQESSEHNQPINVGNYLAVTLRDTFENWQSEFLQLIWQVAGLSILWYVGSPQSKESEERKEEKLDIILKRLDPENARQLLNELEEKFPKK